MANFKENPRNQTVTFRLTPDEKKELQKIANKHTNGKVSELVWQLCLNRIKEEKENGTETEQETIQFGG